MNGSKKARKINKMQKKIGFIGEIQKKAINYLIIGEVFLVDMLGHGQNPDNSIIYTLLLQNSQILIGEILMYKKPYLMLCNFGLIKKLMDLESMLYYI